jgi:hypothetical protein
MTKIKGLEDSVTFGYLSPDNKDLRPEAEVFLKAIMQLAEKR